MERNSLEHLLHHFCGVAAKKEYQNADWRLRPLPDEMLRYAREDTHYLLYIYDLMLALLVSMPKNAESSDPPLVEVFKRSYDVCMQLYEKEIMSESSYLYLYGLQRAGFNAQQLAVASGLFEWRDAIARTEDEGTGYILPNKTLLEIAKEMPLTSSKLRRLLKTKHSYVERHLDSVVSIIRHSMQHAAAFEAAAQQLKEAAEQLKENHREVALQEVEVNDGCEVIARDTSAGLESVGTNSIRGDHVTTGGISSFKEATVQLKKKPLEQGSSVSECLTTENLGSSNLGENGKMNTATSSPSGSLTIALQGGDKNVQTDVSPAIKTSAASVKALKKPMGAFGALLGNAAAKRKFDTDKQVSDNIKLEKIRSQVSLPFHSFSGKKEPPQPVVDEPTATVSEGPHSTSSKSSADPAPGSTFEDIIALDNSSDAEEVKFNNSETTNTNMDQKSAVEGDKDASVSLTDLSASFQKCFQTANQNRNYAQSKKAQEPSGLFQLKPFDYAAAREQVRFGEDAVKESEMGDDQDKKYRLNSTGKVKNSAIDQVERQDETMELRQGRRRQAFPASGNRSITFR